MLYDSLLQTPIYISSVNDINKLYFYFNWGYYDDSKWNIDRLFNKLISKNVIDAEIEIYNDKILFISDLNNLAKLFNLLGTLELSHKFIYEVERIKVNPLINRVKNYNFNKEYFKVIINNYD